MMKQDIFVLSHDGKTTLHGILWAPENQAVRGTLQLVHGMVEHIDRYSAFSEYLTTQGFAVIGHDHLGHGRSVTEEKNLGYFAEKDGARIVIDDIALFTEEAAARFPGVPHFILGHSMGSFMVRRYMTRYGDRVNGVIIMGTGFIPAALASVGRIMASISVLFRGPYFRSRVLTALALGSNNKPFAPARTEFDWLSRNEDNVDRYMEDPLCGYLFTASAYKDFFTFIGEVGAEKDFEKIPKALPVLITSGALDPVGGRTACPKVLASLKKTGLTDVTMKLYEEDRHEILNELDREQVYQDILAWLLSKI